MIYNIALPILTAASVIVLFYSIQASSTCNADAIELKYDIKSLEAENDYFKCKEVNSKIKLFNEKCDGRYNENVISC